MDGSLFAFGAEMHDAAHAIHRLFGCRCMKKMPTSRLGEEAGAHRVDGGVRRRGRVSTDDVAIDGTIVAHGWFLIYRASACVVPLPAATVRYTLTLLSGLDGRAMCCLQHA